jgi:hypothetical protein
MEQTPVQGPPRTVPLSGPGAPTLYLARPLPTQLGEARRAR